MKDLAYAKRPALRGAYIGPAQATVLANGHAYAFLPVVPPQMADRQYFVVGQ